MRLRPLGPALPEVPLLGYGCWPLSEAARPPESDAVRVIHQALDLGVRLLDTADAYAQHQGEVGHNERLVAKAISSWGGDRSAVLVATKGGFVRPDGRWVHNARPEHLKQACDRSLKALGVERIDLYQLHSPDPGVPFEESIGMLDELRSQGKIRAVGLSNVTVAHLESARGVVPVATVQNRLNVFFREAIAEGVVEYCRAHGLGFLAYSPLGGGRLNKKLGHHPLLGELARRHGVSAHVVALCWVLAQGDPVVAIPAARRMEHLRDSLSAAMVELGPDDLAAIDQAEFDRS